MDAPGARYASAKYSSAIMPPCPRRPRSYAWRFLILFLRHADTCNARFQACVYVFAPLVAAVHHCYSHMPFRAE
jgi:hypothetical protein